LLASRWPYPMLGARLTAADRLRDICPNAASLFSCSVRRNVVRVALERGGHTALPVFTCKWRCRCIQWSRQRVLPRLTASLLTRALHITVRQPLCPRSVRAAVSLCGLASRSTSRPSAAARAEVVSEDAVVQPVGDGVQRVVAMHERPPNSHSGCTPHACSSRALAVE
jgi:hypothetical protein